MDASQWGYLGLRMKERMESAEWGEDTVMAYGDNKQFGFSLALPRFGPFRIRSEIKLGSVSTAGLNNVVFFTKCQKWNTTGCPKKEHEPSARPFRHSWMIPHRKWLR